MFNYKSLLAVTLAALSSVALAAPAKRGAVRCIIPSEYLPSLTPSPMQDVSASIEVCTSASATGCVTVPVVSGDCVNLTEGLSFLNKEITVAVIPGGFVCTFFQ